MARSSNYTYNPATGEWVQSSNNTSSSSDTSTPTTPKTTSENLTNSTSDSDSSAGKTEKKYNNIEINTLSGTLNFIATKETIKLRAGDTVNVQGIGKYLSGNYYVQDVTRQISSNGYSHSATLIRTDFGSSLKISTETQAKKPVEKPVPSTPSASTAQRTYTVKKGDCLWNIAKQFYDNGGAYTKIYDANTNQIANPNLIYPGQVFVIP